MRIHQTLPEPQPTQSKWSRLMSLVRDVLSIYGFVLMVIKILEYLSKAEGW